MKKEDKEWLKENAPWDYDALYGDPVTGFSGSDDSGCLGVIFIGLIALGVWGLAELIF